MNDPEHSAILDAVALVDAQARDDRLAVAAILHASDDVRYLRRVAGLVAYMASRLDLDDPEARAAVRRCFVTRELGGTVAW